MEEATLAFLGALVGCIVPTLALRFSYKQLFAETVSANRMDWINAWRENVSRFLACAEALRNNKSSDKAERMRMEKEMYEARGMVVSRLNLDETNHQTMLALMNSFDLNCDDKSFISQREAILALARKILKPEWERVKKEAHGKNGK